MSTIQTCLKRASELTSVSDSARLDVELLLCRALACERSYLFTWPERELTSEQLDAFECLLQRRVLGHPVAHLLGEREFWSLPLSVNESTLIPRPDTEILVETVLGLNLGARIKCLDLGTGTGAIALALASENPEWQVLAVDRSSAAVALATTNANALGFLGVEVRCSDWFSEVEGTFELIVSNPPYIDADDVHLDQGDVRFEPVSALVAADQGYADLCLIADLSRRHLAPGGWLLMEHGYQQANQLRQTLTGLGYKNIETRKDYGGNDRVTLGQLSFRSEAI